MALSSQFAMQKVFKIRGFDIDTGRQVLTLTKMLMAKKHELLVRIITRRLNNGKNIC